MLGGAIFRQHLPKHIGLMCIADTDQLGKDALLFASDQSAVAIPKEKINLCEKIGPYYIIAWSSFPAVILPESAAQSPETAALLRRIEERRSST